MKMDTTTNLVTGLTAAGLAVTAIQASSYILSNPLAVGLSALAGVVAGIFMQVIGNDPTVKNALDGMFSGVFGFLIPSEVQFNWSSYIDKISDLTGGLVQKTGITIFGKHYSLSQCFPQLAGFNVGYMTSTFVGRLIYQIR